MDDESNAVVARGMPRLVADESVYGRWILVGKRADVLAVSRGTIAGAETGQPALAVGPTDGRARACPPLEQTTSRDSQQHEVAWHYTTAKCWAGILADEAIHPATAGLADNRLTSWLWAREALERVVPLEQLIGAGDTEELAGECAAVWFSRRPTWEPTATKGVIDHVTGERRTATSEEMDRAGRVRIGVQRTGLSTWVEHRRVGRIASDEARKLVRVAIEMGANPGDWLLHYGDVPRAKWVAVQTWDGEGWVEIPDGGDRKGACYVGDGRFCVVASRKEQR